MAKAIKFKVTISYKNTAEKANYKASFVVEEVDENRAIFAAAKLFFALPATSVVVINRLTVTNLTTKKESPKTKKPAS